MPSTYSPDLRIELIANGEKTGTWGTITNTNLGTVLEDAISGLATVSITSSAQALSIQDGSADQARNAAVTVTTTTTANFSVFIPPVTKLYTFTNSSAYIATVYASTVAGNTTPAGTGVAVPAGKSVLLRCTGSNVVEQFNHVVGAFSTTTNATVGGNLAVTGNTTVTGTTTFTGIPSGPTATPGTNTTQLATTAFVTAVSGTLGTMSTQNANNVNITGGVISGMTSIADTAGNVRALPINAKTASYVLLASDAGKAITITTGGVTLNTGVLAVGDTVSIYNNGASAQTITQGTGVTIKLTLSNLTGNRTLAAYGLCTLLCIATNTFVITGAGVT